MNSSENSIINKNNYNYTSTLHKSMTEQFDPFTGTYRIKHAAARATARASIAALTNAIKSSYGALGLDKMCISTAGDVTVTNDGATILENIRTDDPLADLIVELSRLQDTEMGDGTTGVVLLASALIEKGFELIEKGLHPSVVVSGYKIAYREAAAHIRTNLSTDNVDMHAVVRTTLASKITNHEHFTDLVVNAVLNTERIINNKKLYDLKKINILKKEGGHMTDSIAVEGYCINAQPASKQMPCVLQNPRICLIDFDLVKIRMPLNVNIVVNDPDHLEENRKAEIALALERVKKILENADVILTSRNIDDICLKPVIEQNKIAIKRVPINDLETLSKTLNIPIARTENVETILIKSIEVKSIAHENLTILKTEDNKNSLSSIILRGPNEQVLEEMHRSVHDGLSTLVRLLHTPKVVPGGGALEIGLSIFFDSISRSLSKKESISILTFSECLHIIPKTLANNSGYDVNAIISDLITTQSKLAQAGNTSAFNYGIDVLTGEIDDNIKRGIVEPSVLKLRALRAAVEVAIAILRIDEIVKVPKVPPKPKRNQCGDY